MATKPGFRWLFILTVLCFLGGTLNPMGSAVATGSTFTVTYHYDSADTGNSKNSDTFTVAGTPITLPAPGKTGYVFAGWYGDSLLTNPPIGQAGDPYSPSSSGGAYAKWVSCSSYLASLVHPASSGIATWTANAISSNSSGTLSVTVVDDAGFSVSGVSGCLSLDTTNAGTAFTSPSVSPFVESPTGSGSFQAEVTFGSFAPSVGAGYSVTVNSMSVLMPDEPVPGTYSVNAPSIRVDQGPLDIASQDVTFAAAVKTTIATKVLTISNLNSTSVTLANPPTVSQSLAAKTATITSAVGDSNFVTYTTSGNAPFSPGQFVSVSGFGNADLNINRLQVISTFNNTFTVAAPVSASETATASATSIRMYLDTSDAAHVCKKDRILAAEGAPGSTCTITVKWGIATNEATTQTKLGTLSITTGSATQNFDIDGTAIDGAKHVDSYVGASDRQVLDSGVQWCATSAGMVFGGDTTCTTPDSWSSAYSDWDLDPAGRWYNILKRYYGGQDHPWGNIPGTSHWTNCYIYMDSSCGNQQTLVFRIPFTMPSAWYSPALTLTVNGDNYVEAWINPTSNLNGTPALSSSQPSYFATGGVVQDGAGAQTTCTSGWVDYPNNTVAGGGLTTLGNMYADRGQCVDSRSHIVPGTNYVYVRITDAGGLAGMNFRLDVAYRGNDACVSGCGGGAPVPKVALKPAFDSPTRLVPGPGYTFHVINYDPDYVWTGTVAGGGTVTVDSDGLATVAGGNGAATISAARDDYPTGNATQNPPPPPPLLPVTLAPTLSPSTSFYSQNLSGAYTQVVSLTPNPNHAYTSGSYHYSVRTSNFNVISADSAPDGLSITFTAQGLNGTNLIKGQLVSVFGLDELSVKNWQVVSVNTSDGNFSAVAPSGATASALTASEFTSSPVGQNLSVTKLSGGNAKASNCVASEATSTSFKLTAVALAGDTINTNPGTPIVSPSFSCTVVVSHDDDGTYDASSGNAEFNFVKEIPTSRYSGDFAIMNQTHLRALNLNSVWSNVSGCTSPSKYSYTFDGKTNLTTSSASSSSQNIFTFLETGGYFVTDNYAGDYNCEASNSPNASSGFAVYDSNTVVYGAGSYNANGRSNFGFELHKIKGGFYRGNLVWNWNNRWRFRGNLFSFRKYLSYNMPGYPNSLKCAAFHKCAVMTGSGFLEYFDGNSWASAGSQISINLSVIETSKAKEPTPGLLGIRFGYSPSGGQPNLPVDQLWSLMFSENSDGGIISVLK